jgi:hypothetical protein
MPAVSVALALTATVSLTAAPLTGDVIETVGAVVSMATEILLVAVFPAVSVAVALKVCDPLATPALFQETL